MPLVQGAFHDNSNNEYSVSGDADSKVLHTLHEWLPCGTDSGKLLFFINTLHRDFLVPHSDHKLYLYSFTKPPPLLPSPPPLFFLCVCVGVCVGVLFCLFVVSIRVLSLRVEYCLH